MAELSLDEQKISDRACDYVRDHKKDLIAQFADPILYTADDRAVALFMAGSPGAGKTEVSRRLIETFKKKPVRIDADAIREFVPGYEGEKAYLYQRAANKGVNLLLEHVLKKKINFILDGTFAYQDVELNIERCLKRGRPIEIYYVYQEPQRAWELVVAREAIEHRRVSKEVFVRSFFAARNNVEMIKSKFGTMIDLCVIEKNFSTGQEQIFTTVTSLDQCIPKTYTQLELEGMI